MIKKQLHVVFFPFMAHGHMIPTLDMAKLFASHGVKTTILTTPLNAPVFSKAIERSKKLGLQIAIHLFNFPTAEVGLPEGCESVDKITGDEMLPQFIKAVGMLQGQLDQFLEEVRPDCLVADMFFPWTTDSAAKFDIPRLVFHGMGYFALCASENVRLYKPFKNVSSDTEPFVLPNLPHEIKVTRSQLGPNITEESENDFSKLLNQMKESELTSYGVIVNSFKELEPDFAYHYRKFLKRRAWQVGPLSLCNRDIEDKVERGKEASIDKHECLKWLDSKNPKSVIFVCFGSIAKFTVSQLREIAMGLEASEQHFIWVLRKDNAGNEETWLPEGFEERIKGKGLIIRGWAPQVLILDHEAIGGFVTHCGWNSTLEGISAGVPMVTWPLFAEQFFNEKFVTEILKTGVAVGSTKWNKSANEGVMKEAIAKTIKRVIVSEEAEEMRNRAKSIKAMAKAAIEEGGSSYADLDALIEELSYYKCKKMIQ